MKTKLNCVLGIYNIPPLTNNSLTATYTVMGNIIIETKPPVSVTLNGLKDYPVINKL